LADAVKKSSPIVSIQIAEPEASKGSLAIHNATAVGYGQERRVRVLS
jgi:hypothetical protein